MCSAQLRTLDDPRRCHCAGRTLVKRRPTDREGAGDIQQELGSFAAPTVLPELH